MIYIIKQEAGGVVSKKVNSILVFSCICKMGYYPSPFQFVYFPNSGGPEYRTNYFLFQL